MELYNKPVVLLNEELSEGVYAASGGGGLTFGDITATVSGNVDVNISPDGGWDKDWYYNITFTNPANDDSGDWKVVFAFPDKTIVKVEDWSGLTVSFSGNTLTYSGSFVANGSKSLRVHIVIE